MTTQIRFFCGMLLALTLAACGGDVVPTPTVPPPPTATPFSTPLPDIPTAIPAGFNEGNPLRLVIVPADADAADDLIDEFEAQLAGRTTLALEVELVDSQSEALAAICNSGSGQVTLAWIDGLTLAAALGQECGVPILQIQREVDDDTQTGEASVMLFNSEAIAATEVSAEDGEPNEFSAVPSNTFCRISYTNLYSWIIPTMTLHGAGFDIADLVDVDERADYDELIAGITTGACGVTALPEQVWEEYEADNSASLENEAGEAIVRVAATSAEFPYGVLVVPFAASLDAINEITDALLTMDILFGDGVAISTPIPEPEATAESTTEADSEPTEEVTSEATSTVSDESALSDQLGAFFGEGVLIPVDLSDFAEFTEFLDSTGLNFNQLGN